MRVIFTLREHPSLIADTFSLLTFAFAVGMFVEIVVAGMTLEQSFQSRLFAIPINLIMGRPYGGYRDWLFNIVGTENRGQIAATIVDVFAFLSFMIPQYIAVLWWVGADTHQVLVACSSVLVMSVVLGRPYGLYLVFCRRFIAGSLSKVS